MKVAISTGRTEYPPLSDFSPDEIFPEYPFAKPGNGTNFIYKSVRNSLHLLGLDDMHYGTPNWNPLAEIITPGTTVVIKPNFVMGRNYNPKFPLECSITHGSVLRPIVDYVYLALHGEGNIIICDAPQHNAIWKDIIAKTGVELIKDFYDSRREPQKIQLQLLDLRPERVEYKYGVVWKRYSLPGDPQGYANVDLGEDSEMRFGSVEGLYGADYDRSLIISAHSNGKNIYNICKTVLSADTIILVPKLKVHKKCGVTLNLKLLVGINGLKNLVPHYRIPSRDDQGDCFSSPMKFDKMNKAMMDFFLSKGRWNWGKYFYGLLWNGIIKRLGRKFVKMTDDTYEYGNWYGNDTVWRAALDLMKILVYADKKGNLNNQPQRKYFSVIDGIIGGEGEGPLAPSPIASGMVLAGREPIAVDFVATRLIGFDPKKIKMLERASNTGRFPIGLGPDDQIELRTENDEVKKSFEKNQAYIQFKPHPGWEGHIEL